MPSRTITNLEDLPNEILLQISEALDKTADVWSLAQHNRRRYNLFRDDMYRYDTEQGFGDSNALLYASRSPSTRITDAQRRAIFGSAIKAGADINMLVYGVDPDERITSSQEPPVLPRNCRIGFLRAQAALDSGNTDLANQLRWPMWELAQNPSNPQGPGGGLVTAAVRRNDAAMVRRLLELGCDPNEELAGNGRPIYTAVRMGSHTMVELLLAHPEIDPSVQVHIFRPAEGVPRTAFSLACAVSPVTIVQMLYDHPGVSMFDDNSTTCVIAMKAKRKDVMQRLISSEKSKPYMYALWNYAFTSDDSDLVRSLARYILTHGSAQDYVHARTWHAMAQSSGLDDIAALVVQKWPREF